MGNKDKTREERLADTIEGFFDAAESRGKADTVATLELLHVLTVYTAHLERRVAFLEQRVLELERAQRPVTEDQPA